MNMNSVSIILISAYLLTLDSVVLAVETYDSPELQYVEECNLEQNFSHFPFTLQKLNTTDVPRSKEEACILDCYFFKRGLIVEKIHSTFVQYQFARPPLEDSIYGPGFSKMSERQAKAVDSCMKFVSRLQIEKCWLIYELRFCLFMNLN